jgi:hypothetical protein
VVVREPQQDTRPMNRRRFVAAALGGAGALAGGTYLLARSLGSDGKTNSPAVSRDRLAQFADNIRSGGPPKDGIPPIEEPDFVSAGGAGFLAEDDVVFGLVRDGETRAYPQLVLVWHEIVNDEFTDGPLSVTYCPLTGSAVAFRGTAPDGAPYTFGTSGDLVNSNLLMYDRETDSRWPQILGQAIVGPSRGHRLEEVPLEWTTWERWRRAHPETVVLSTETGHLRTYGDDPYGSYTPLGGYYEPDSSLLFPVMREDGRFAKKEVFIGAKVGGARLAVRKETLRRRGAVRARIGGVPVAVLYDAALGEARAFLARARGRELNFERSGENGYVDRETRSSWGASGRAFRGPLARTRLRRLISYDVMWFAWVAFFPQTEVVA